jgi:plasminogen activator
MIAESLKRHGLSLLAVCTLGGAVFATVGAAEPVVVAPGRSAEVVATPVASPVQFSLGVGAGYLTGESRELVYWPWENNHQASELTWKIDSLFMLGANSRLQLGSRFAVNFTGWFKATDGDGTMDDYDWMVPGGDWTDWSHHEQTDVIDGSIVDINAEFAFFRSQNVTFNIIAGYKRDNFGWETRGGDYIYSENGFRNEEGSFSDQALGIGYEQTMTSLYAGIGVGARLDRLQLDARLIYSPLVQGEAVDHHYMRNLVTYDDFEDGDMISFDLAASYSFTTNMALTFAYSYQRYDTMQGDSVWHFRDQGVTYYISDGAGMDQESSLVSTGLRFTF